MPALDDETDEEMQERIEREERARFETDGFEEDEAQTISLTKSSSGGHNELKEVAKRFGLLGMVAFGGPPAHVALFQVQTWRPGLVDDGQFASLFALTQCLPGPSSTQLAIALGILMAGPYGGLVAFGCFSVTATTTMMILGSAVHMSAGFAPSGSLATFLSSVQMGLAAAAVALVFKAALMLSTKLVVDNLTKALNVAAAAVALLAPGTSWVLPLTLGLAGGASSFE
eukprot:2747513-Prymnesium_polylepis.1